MEIYSIEIYAKKLTLKGKLRSIGLHNIQLLVTCSGIFSVSISYDENTGQIDVIHMGSGMAVIFPCTQKKITSEIYHNIKATIVTNEQEPLCSGPIKWPSNFRQIVKQFKDGNCVYFQHDGIFSLLDAEQIICATVSLQLCLSYLGRTILIPIKIRGSELNIPLPRGHLDHKDDMLSVLPLYETMTKPVRSYMDFNLLEYLGGSLHELPKPGPITSEYIKENLCGQNTCPAVKKFKKLGLGPSTPEPNKTRPKVSITDATLYSWYNNNYIDDSKAPKVVSNTGNNGGLCYGPSVEQIYENTTKRCLCPNCQRKKQIYPMNIEGQSCLFLQRN